MSKIIIFGSQYGTSKKYAEELSRRTNIDLVSYEDVDNINQYNTIIYIGGLYAGGVLGMSKILKQLTILTDKKILIMTVGLADPNNSENIKNIQNGIKRQLSQSILEKTKIYHLRGGIDYSKLNFKHKFMMSLLYKKVKGLPEEKKDSEIKALIETYNQKVDFLNFSYLDEVINNLNNSQVNKL